jgi:hypothetical protein
MMVAAIAQHADAAPVDTDITFVIDQSGSMDDEFDFLGGAIGGFLNDLESSSNINQARGALVSYEDSPTLQQGLTADATTLEDAFDKTNNFGGTENALGAVDAAIPEGNEDLNLGYKTNAVKSTVLITDEDADDATSYSNSFGSGASALGSLLDDKGFLNNVIAEQSGNGDFPSEFEQIARPSGGDALFSISDFRNNRQQFFNDFTNAKIEEVEEVAQVPAPSTIALMVAGFLGLSVTGWRRHSS